MLVPLTEASLGVQLGAYHNTSRQYGSGRERIEMDERLRLNLVALADKYRVMGQMRAAATRVNAVQARAQMSALAARFPGALRELDRLPAALIDARERAIEAALERRAAEPWMLLQVDYHGFMRAALRLRGLLLAQGGAVSMEGLYAAGYRPAADEPPLERFGAAELAAVMRPPSGRLNPWVLTQVAREHGVTPEDVHDALFRVS